MFNHKVKTPLFAPTLSISPNRSLAINAIDITGISDCFLAFLNGHFLRFIATMSDI